MRYVEAFADSGENWYYKKDYREKSVFLAGGISNCPNWQRTAFINLGMSNFENLVLINPRRKSFDVSDHTASVKQIEWEYHHLKAADAILFWFPCETLCPITLFEYGKWLTKDKPLFVGCDVKYARMQDLIIQTKMEKPSLRVHENLLSLLSDVKNWCVNHLDDGFKK